MLRLPTSLLLYASFIVDLAAATSFTNLASFTNPIGADFGMTYDLG